MTKNPSTDYQELMEKLNQHQMPSREAIEAVLNALPEDSAEHQIILEKLKAIDLMELMRQGHG